MNKNKNLYFWLLLALLMLMPAIDIFADGSRNWAGLGGRRAFLRSSATATENWPFPNLGTHYVYAKAGERITLASSLQAVNGTPRIRLYKPNGTEVILNFSEGGRIGNRTQEMSGPHLFNTTSGGYRPEYYQVLTGEDGIYRVEFLSSGASTSSSIDADQDNLGQTPSASVVTIAAWDVSVINTANNGFVSGRVYTNILNLSVGINSPESNGFNGLVYVRTYDGYTYRVKNNSNNGMFFTFFVNNNGFVDPDTQEPIYKSLNSSSSSYLTRRVQNPNNADAGTHITHKLFYTLPADDMPVEAPIAITGNGGSSWSVGNTWLQRDPQMPTISNVFLKGVDGSTGQMSQKGGIIEFNANIAGNFRLEVINKDGVAIRTITGHAFEGPNRVVWDGKNDDGVLLPAGSTDLNVSVQLQGAEVHFPFLDMEYNKQGTIIELLNHNDLNSVVTDLVYWDDSDISDKITGTPSNPKNNSHLPPINSAGISSNDNGHIWGWNASGNSSNLNTMGDLRSIDTWAFITGEKEDEDFSAEIKVADLKITDVSTQTTSVSIGGEITYTVKIQNGESGDGGSDVVGAVFTFRLPEGFEDSNVTPVVSFSCTNSSESVHAAFDETTNSYYSKLDLPNGCEATYTFVVRVTSEVTPGNNQVVAGILRPDDVTDPNATNRSNPNNSNAPESEYPAPDVDTYYVSPFSAEYECSNRDPNEVDECNNIVSATIIVSANTTVAADDFAETDQNVSVNGNLLDNDYDPEGDNQRVTTTGTNLTTEKGGEITISSNGDYTYTPPRNFSGIDTFIYKVCDDATPANACAEATLIIGVGICTTDVDGNSFDWGPISTGSTVTETIVQPSSNYGFILDIYELDNSFNMEINGTLIALHEIEFQSQGTPSGINIKFADGDEYETNTTQENGAQGDIWEMVGDADNPLIRVVISPTGSVSLYGSKTSFGELYPLILKADKNGVLNMLNSVPWNAEGFNNITVTQNVVGATLMRGYGYGATVTPCPNYWYGGTDGSLNSWSVAENWTDNRVPLEFEDVEFATADNNNGNPAVQDLHLDNLDQDGSGGRIIGDLINNSDEDLVITTGNQLTINGEVVAKTQQSNGSFGTGNLLVKSTNITNNENEPTGTLLINPDNNPDGVQAVVEFYNTAYDCADCGFYTRSWQYFGIPVKQSDITPPFISDNEVNEWDEPTNGDKWITPNNPLTAFTGYQVTRNTTAEPDYINAVHLFNGSLNITDASVALTGTNDVNYPGVNLIGNSYTAAIPINTSAISVPAGVEQTIYLFNTGTRDEWRKLNGGSTVGGVAGGQYLSVPFNLAGQNNFPDRIPSMHTFMILVPEGNGEGNLGISYDQLVKNTTVDRGDGTQIVTRSAGVSKESESSTSIPSLLIEVVGEKSADRVWIFAKEGTTHGFDNGWDGRKITENGIVQLYVEGTDESRLQAATVPTMENVSLGFVAGADVKYTLEFSLSEHMNGAGVFLHDQVTGSSVQLTNGASYSFEASKGENSSRFRLTQSGEFGTIGDEALITVEQNAGGKVVITNKSGNAVTAFISNSSGAILQTAEVVSESETEIDNISTGLYVVRLQNAVMNDVRRLIVK